MIELVSTLLAFGSFKDVSLSDKRDSVRLSQRLDTYY